MATTLRFALLLIVLSAPIAAGLAASAALTEAVATAQAQGR